MPAPADLMSSRPTGGLANAAIAKSYRSAFRGDGRLAAARLAAPAHDALSAENQPMAGLRRRGHGECAEPDRRCSRRHGSGEARAEWPTDGMVDLVLQAVWEDMACSGMDSAARGRFGLSPSPVRKG